MTEITVYNGHTHKVECGSTDTGWLTGCGIRVRNGLYAVRQAVSKIDCSRCKIN